MIQQAKSAASAEPGNAQAEKLLTDLDALNALALSPQWVATPAAATSPQVITVQDDCKSFPTS